MKIVHLSDIHIWRYSINPVKLWGKRAVGMAELFTGRAKKFRLERMEDVVERVKSINADHLLITGDLTTTAMRREFEQAREALGPLLGDPDRVSILPGNHDRYTSRSVRTRAFERVFGAFSPGDSFPWLRHLDERTAILALDATRAHLSATGRLPDDQFHQARELLLTTDPRPKRLIVACHYPVAAPEAYQSELRKKRMVNAADVARWLRRVGPHLYCSGHVHAAWAHRPHEVPEQLSLNAGAPLLRDPTGRRPPGFLEIDLTEQSVTVKHHAWTGMDWSIMPMVTDLRLFGSEAGSLVRD
ncbi:metallophosphoesterase family protein [Tautonia marina]|uniref:metallophosphoesterase family protein n=1 Tax=Tautonia marina TaxID=2653855 RepID=UPI00126074BC|nr:metallophosphoesterase [Tautonia marina]